eukprot:CFRG4036T1
MKRRLCLLALVVKLAAANEQHGWGDIKSPIELKPNLGKNLLKIQPFQSLFFRGVNLDASTSYEVRVSYPATYPANFKIEVVNGCEFSIPNKALRRNLLNMEKIEIDVANIREYQTVGEEFECLVEVSAVPNGVPIIPSLNERPIVFNIVIESLVFGIPSGAIPLIGLVALGTVAVFLTYVLFLKTQQPGTEHSSIKFL